MEQQVEYFYNQLIIMRIAHLILAHQGPDQLARLLAALAHPAADCYIHLDKKADFAAFAFLGGWPQVFFTRCRLDVKWGGYSLTRAVLEGSREILAHPAGYEFINVLSAQDYPLKPAEQIQQFLRQHAGQSFLECAPLGSAWWRANMRRIERYNLTDFSFPGRYALQKGLNTWLPRRKFPLPYTLYGGNMGGWYTLSRAAAAYALAFIDAHARLRRFALFTWGSDEFLLHTVLLNSPLRATITTTDNLRYIDWSAGGNSPRTLGPADLPALLASPKLWARKFDPEPEPAVLAALDRARAAAVAA